MNLPCKLIIDENAYDIRELKYLRDKNPHRVIIGHININSARNRFELLVKLVSINLDILMVSEKDIILSQSHNF